jgi:pimeloyl-ACP methyl ester carboxylesterase
VLDSTYNQRQILKLEIIPLAQILTETILLTRYLILVLLLGVPGDSWENAFGYEKWPAPDFKKTELTVDGRACFLTQPKVAAPGRPWVWRARFPGYHSEIDQLLLADGYHIAYMNTNGMFGSPKALKHWKAFYDALTTDFDLNKKVVLEGVSRGGLFVYRWAKAYPETVACIYNDTPVCDFKSWPGGRGMGVGSDKDWKQLITEYGFPDEKTALAYDDNPIDKLETIAKAQIPIMHIVTENDRIVPPSENTYVLKKNLEALGHGDFSVISLPRGPRLNGHHFDLDHPQIGYHFIRKHSDFANGFPVYLRSGLENSRHVFNKTEKGRVAFLGGSITQMEGWRNHVADSLRKRFPETEFDFVFAGIGSTDSTMGAFRLRDHVFSRGQVDLLFIESAVNELHNGRRRDEIIRSTEGIILNARRQNPNIDIVAQYLYDMPYVEQIRKGRTPWQIQTLDRVSLQYGINAIDQARWTTSLFDSGTISRQQFGGCHPAPPGHLKYAEMIDLLFDRAWSGPPAETLVPHPGSWRMDRFSYDRGHFQALSTAKIKTGFKRVEKWQASSGRVRPLDNGVPYLEALEPGAELTVEFNGTAIGLPMVAGPDVGIIEWQVDGGPRKRLDQFTKWSKGLHIPWIYMLETNLKDGPHTLTLRTTNKKNPDSKGFACRFRYFAVNGD